MLAQVVLVVCGLEASKLRLRIQLRSSTPSIRSYVHCNTAAIKPTVTHLRSCALSCFLLTFAWLHIHCK